jgi:hypothetical protein
MTESDLKGSSATPMRRFQRILDRIIDAKSEELPALGLVLALYFLGPCVVLHPAANSRPDERPSRE